ncbi:MAG: hypothetical protein ACOC1U_10135, partial [Spirochaetota bacterium]
RALPHRGEPRCCGDPTEIALLAVGSRFGVHQEVLRDAEPRIAEQPFDSDRKMMSTVVLAKAGASGAASEGVATATPTRSGSTLAIRTRASSRAAPAPAWCSTASWCLR